MNLNELPQDRIQWPYSLNDELVNLFFFYSEIVGTGDVFKEYT
jgi:hypothetical protein